MERRNVLRGLATGLAGAVAAPSAASVAASTEGVTARPRVQSAASEAAPAIASALSAPEIETFQNLCELLVPGSVEAGVPELVGRSMAVDTPETRGEFLASLRAFEGEARTAHGLRWIELPPTARASILEEAASASRPELHTHMVRLRDVVARAYLATEPGMRRLGWTGRSAWRELPACAHEGDGHR